MTVRVKLFAVARQIAGRDEFVLDVAEGATIADARDAIAAQVPALADILRHSLWAVDEAYVTDDTRIDAESEIALIPPVSGG